MRRTEETSDQSLAPNFLIDTDPNAVQTQVDQLVQYLLSIDEDKPAQELPSPAGAQGGSLCAVSFTAQ